MNATEQALKALKLVMSLHNIRDSYSYSRSDLRHNWIVNLDPQAKRQVEEATKALEGDLQP